MSLPFGTALAFTKNVTTASTLVLAANGDRRYAIITNDSDTVMYLALGEAAVANKGVRLAASGGTYEITEFNMFSGEVYGIHASSGNKVCCGVEGA